MSHGYHPKRRKPRYRVVMDGRGGLVVEELNPLWLAVFAGKYHPISPSLNDMVACDEFIARRKWEEVSRMNIELVIKEYPMNNVISLRPDPLRRLYELIDSIHDTQLTPEQKLIANEALALLQKIIEAKSLSHSGHSVS